jgi:circadian clock protein KaiB
MEHNDGAPDAGRRDDSNMPPGELPADNVHFLGAEGLERLIAESASETQRYVLRLYVTGTTPQSARAIANLKAVCEKHLEGRYELEVIDIYQQPELARSAQIVAAPTLVKTLPLPLRRLIGDLSDQEKVLVGLGLRPI